MNLFSEIILSYSAIISSVQQYSKYPTMFLFSFFVLLCIAHVMMQPIQKNFFGLFYFHLENDFIISYINDESQNIPSTIGNFLLA